MIKRSKQFCSAYGCNSTPRRNPDVSFHNFPVPQKRKVSVQNTNGETELIDIYEAWRMKLNMRRNASRHMKICSRHFVPQDYYLPGFESKRRRLKLNAVPSQNLSKPPLADPSNKKQADQLKKSVKKRKKKEILYDPEDAFAAETLLMLRRPSRPQINLTIIRNEHKKVKQHAKK